MPDKNDTVTYQENYTQNPAARKSMYDDQGRTRKAAKVISVLEDFFDDLKDLGLLDVSCSTGIMAYEYSLKAGSVTGIDIDRAAVEFASEHNNRENIEYLVMDAMNTGFEPDMFDILVCNQTYEHVPDAKKLLDEIYRVLKPGGVCYFGATNRLSFFERHYGKLPLLSVIPKPMAHLYLRLTGKARYYYETHLTMWGLKKIVSQFELIDYTRKVVQDPVRFEATDMIRPGGMTQKISLALLRHAYWLFPGYIWLLRKPAGHSGQ